MKPRSRRWRTRDLGLELEFMPLKLVELRLKTRSPKAFSYCLDQAIKFFGGFSRVRGASRQVEVPRRGAAS